MTKKQLVIVALDATIPLEKDLRVKPEDDIKLKAAGNDIEIKSGNDSKLSQGG